VLALSAVLLSWTWRAPADVTFSGWFQGDMPTYACYGRMAASTATTLSYANPHDLRESPPPVLVNLPISVIGWLLRLGLPAPWTEHVLRLVFGVLMYAALAALLRRVFRPGPWFWAAMVLVGVGSGFAWLGALRDASGPWLDAGGLDLNVPALARRWREGVRAIEAPYYWWFLDTFRNLMYPLELAYHALIFGQLWALGTRRFGTSLLFFALACLSNPFVGIQACGVQLASLSLACLRAPRPLRAWLASGAIAAGFVAYYGVLLPSDEVIRSVQEQHQAQLDSPLTLASLLAGHGPALLAPLAVLLDPAFRRALWKRFHLVPVLTLVAWTALLSQNSRFGLDEQLMPMHFTRGYLHAGLWIVLLAWLQLRLGSATAPRRGAFVAALLAVLTLPDALLFVEDQYRDMPHSPTLVWNADWQQMHDELRREERPRRVLVNSYAFGRQICALHPHRTVFGGPLTTPHYAERQAALEEFRSNPRFEPPLVAWADRALVQRSDARLTAAFVGSRGWRKRLENREWALFERVSEPRAARRN
jgi:hypothetical protein